MVDELDAVDKDPRELRLVRLGERLERLEEGLVRLVRVDKDVGDWLAGLGIGAEVLGGDLAERRDSVLLNPEAELLGRQALVEVARKREERLVKRLVKDNLVGRDRLGREDRLGGRVAEEVRVAGRRGKLGEGLRGLTRGRVRDDDARGRSGVGSAEKGKEVSLGRRTSCRPS